MKDLKVKNIAELLEYMENNPDEPVVRELNLLVVCYNQFRKDKKDNNEDM